ncbi:hypothetical protein GCM10009133_31770 [Cocleimonas flava]|jgi:precorrin-8X/cobalt-precorrin-8 methylmutase|uniref:Precorrin-8X methylmutase n=1 Tax=Cocleimonas flava TaxID=634765 RepID=A0A4R1FAN1_9GAMM|nr:MULTISPECIES: precorrin-8X methylmutase [Cocleimonas]MEB8431297.1 precorrin-8X methylmutase [Cocleimonas sp. KMM 6892]MEC4713931.1 precorrin-8X methylmutase [Cocleimonas sp. KMM 6895]MEC4743262.1 precorrin-8X methylmutase [Cocleimonas sp. KMM 6896]TCJ88978.1 precorrin-8X methylmutase [Cocleimonas flava]
MIKYEKNPRNIQKRSLKTIQESAELSHFNNNEKAVALQMIAAAGDVSLLENIRFSKDAIDIALEALKEDFDLLCDTDNVACAMKQKYLKDEPICLINKASVISQAKSNKHTRSMEAVDLWKPYLSDSIIVIGKEATALYRLLEVLEELKDEDNFKKPSLIIATPSGFTGAVESKNYLWDNHEQLDIPCITVLGSQGGSDVASAAINTLLKIRKETDDG